MPLRFLLPLPSVTRPTSLSRPLGDQVSYHAGRLREGPIRMAAGRDRGIHFSEIHTRGSWPPYSAGIRGSAGPRLGNAAPIVLWSTETVWLYFQTKRRRSSNPGGKTKSVAARNAP